ncbi:Na+/H+ antiporter [Microbacterium sp. B2969]|uniref:Na+/H+ antiporter n=1 Tax=Microbacterium alkaliflavum TaxID=3248839 RepID=A0ABW7Q315_9MICO
MLGLEIAVILGLAVLAGGLAGRYLRFPAPWAWLVIGAALSLLPGLHEVSLPPEVVLFLFLPALLYWEALNTSLQLFRYDLRVILLLSVGLVFATAAVVTGLGQLFGLGVAVALVLGAVLSPTDATAVAAMAPPLPRRIDTMLKGESLVNDGSALALYSVAIAAVVAGRDVTIGEISLRFLLAVGVGIAAGLGVGYLLYLLRRLAQHPSLAGTISVISPFVLYLPAEVLHGSGVVAVVTGGLLLGRLMPRTVSAQSRVQGFDFWRVATYVINGALFVLIGLQARSVFETFADDGWQQVLLLSVLCAVTVFAVRLIWVLLMAPVIRLLDRRPSQRARRVPLRTRLVLVWGGFRGAVSLAAALAVPFVTDANEDFPGRETIIAVTFAVIVFILLGQGATMPLIVRAARIPPEHEDRDEHRLAEVEAIEHALAHLDHDADDVPDDTRAEVRDRLERDLGRARLSVSSPDDEEETDAALRRLLLRTVSRKREAVTRLRRERRIDDAVFLDVQREIDHEELRLREPEDD